MAPALRFGFIDKFVLQQFEYLVALATFQLTFQLPQGKRYHMVVMKATVFGI